MKNLYTLIFNVNNTNFEENAILDLNQLEKDEEFASQALNHLVFSPRRKILDDLLKFAKEGGI